MAALAQPGYEGKTYLLTGPESLSMLEQTAILGEVLGCKLVYEVLPDQVLLQIARAPRTFRQWAINHANAFR